MIKFFGRLFNGEASYQVELHAIQLISANGRIPIPTLISHGSLKVDDPDWNWPYLILQYLDGISIGETWDQLCIENKMRIASEMGRTVRFLHSIPLGEGGYFQMDWDAYRKFLSSQKMNWRKRYQDTGSFPPHFLRQIERFLLPIDDLIDANETPHLIHADLTRDHLLGKIDEGHWITLGVIDFGDSMVGNIFYELVALHLDLFQCDKNLLKIFLDHYKLKKDLYSNFAIRAMNFTLLHQFGEYIFADLFRRYPHLCQIETLENLADELWGIDV